MPFSEMGISVTVDQFNNLARYEPAFRSRLQEWGLPGGAPIATLITARSPEELAALVLAHPDTDFLIPTTWQYAVRSAPQAQFPATPRLFFLLSRTPLPRPSGPSWPCAL
jgi:hypothetical protein